MRDIYEMAYAGFIWLGDTVRTARFEPWGGALDSVWTGGETDMERGIANPKFVSPEHGKREAHIAGLGLTYGKLMQLARLSQRHRAWWCRTWVIQEMVLPARLYVCVGLNMMHWDQLISSCDDWWQYSNRFPDVLLDSTARLKRLDELRTRWQEAKYNIDILELLRLGRQSYATNARDNVYGVLGLMGPQDKHHIRVDYDCAVDKVYAEMTATIINRYQSIDFHCGLLLV